MSEHAGFKDFSADDWSRWCDALKAVPVDASELDAWVGGELRRFFPFKAVLAGYGDLIAGQVRMQYVYQYGHDAAYLAQLGATFELDARGSMAWWLRHRKPFYIDPACPPPFATKFELEEIGSAGLGNVVAHGVLNVRASAGSYVSFTGVPVRPSHWHLDALRLIAPVLNELLLLRITSTYALSKVPALTPRQSAIVRLLAAGRQDKVIARQLGISCKTVRNQLSAIYTRFGVRGRAELVDRLR